MKFIFRLSLLLLALVGSNSLSAFSLNHIENMSGVYTAGTSKKDALRAFKQIRSQSKTLTFLDCPIKLIEKQYNGIESVLVGTKILNTYFDNNPMSMVEFENSIADCETILRRYEENARRKTVKTRAVRDDEILALTYTITKDSTPSQMGIVGLVMNSINQSTVCYTRRTAIEGAYILGGSMGSTTAECFTPMGRHFLLTGPSIGYGIGFMGAITLPNSRLLPSGPNWSFKLYEQKSSKRFFHERHNSFQTGVVIGTAHEIKDAQRGPMKYRRDVKALVGLGIMAERTHNILFHMPLMSLYFSLSKVVDLNLLINKIMNAHRRR